MKVTVTGLTYPVPGLVTLTPETMMLPAAPEVVMVALAPAPVPPAPEKVTPVGAT